MSVFSKLKFAKKAASEKKAVDQRNAAKDNEAEHAMIPYKHVPTHAAYDALSGAPSSWKQDDRHLIKEQHKRRSQMAVSRTGSYLSSSYPSGSLAALSDAPPKLNRPSSYSSYNPTWHDRGDRAYLEQPAPRHSKPSRSASYIDSSSGPTPLISTVTSQNVSPIISSANSASSESSGTHLEIRGAAKPAATTFQEKDIFHRLHTSTNRKIGEAPVGLQALPPLPPLPVKRSAAPDAVQQPKDKPRLGFGFKGKNREVAATA